MKIAREFLSAEQHTDGLLEAIIKLGHGMGVATIAEGIESSSQLARLRDYGCPMGQGYLFSRPIPPAAIPALLDHGRFVLPPDTLSPPKRDLKRSPRHP